MQCNNCGRELSNEDVFCSNCGASVTQNVSEDISAHFENANAGPVQSVDPNQNVVVEATNPANINSTPVVSSVEQAPPAQVSAPVETVQPQTVSQEPAVDTQAQAQTEQSFLTPPEDKYITDNNSQEEIEYNTGRQTTFVSGVTDTSSVVASTEAEPQTQSVAETQAVETTNVVKQPSYDSVTFGPAPIIDPPVAPEYNNVAVGTPVYNVKQKNGMPIGALIAIIAVAAVAFLGAGLGVGFLLFNSAKTGGGNKEEVDPQPISTNKVDVNFGGSVFTIPSDTYDYDLDEEKLAIYNDEIYFYIMTAPAKYSQYLSNIPFLKNHYTELGYSISSASEEKVGDQRYIILNVSNASGKVSIFIRQFGANTSLTGAIARTDDSYATSKDLSDVEAILSSGGNVSRAVAPSKNSKKIENELLKGIIEAEFEDSEEDTTDGKVEDKKEVKEVSDKE